MRPPVSVATLQTSLIYFCDYHPSKSATDGAASVEVIQRVQTAKGCASRPRVPRPSPFFGEGGDFDFVDCVRDRVAPAALVRGGVSHATVSHHSTPSQFPSDVQTGRQSFHPPTLLLSPHQPKPPWPPLCRP